MGRFVCRLIFFAREPSTMAATKKGDVLFAINVLSDNFFDKDDNDTYSTLIEDYFAESGDKTETNTDNEEGMQCPRSLRHPMVTNRYSN